MVGIRAVNAAPLAWQPRLGPFWRAAIRNLLSLPMPTRRQQLLGPSVSRGASSGLPLHVSPTPGISCEAVPASDPAARARGGTSVRRTGAATSFVSFIPLFDGLARYTCSNVSSLATNQVPSGRRSSENAVAVSVRPPLVVNTTISM